MKNNRTTNTATVPPVLLRRPAVALLQALFVVSLAWAAVCLAWSSLRTVDFGYPLFYDVLDIDAHIDRYGPANRYKHGFAASSKTQRLALFGAVVTAVHAGGEGLQELSYT